MNTIMIILMAMILKVNPMVALSVAKLESGLDASAMGDQGKSYGLYQIKCDTAKGVGFKGKCSELRDARVNIIFGLLYLKSKMQKHNLKAALSAYNAGRPLYKAKGRFVNGKYVDIVIRKMKCLQQYKGQMKSFKKLVSKELSPKTMQEFRVALLEEKKLVGLVKLSLTGFMAHDSMIKELDKLEIGENCK